MCVCVGAVGVGVCVCACMCTCVHVISAYTTCCKKLEIHVSSNGRIFPIVYFPIIYWLPKMRKTPISSRFFADSKNCSTKVLSVVSKVFKMIYNYLGNCHNKIRFYSSFEKFWVLKYLFTIINTI